MATVVNNPGDTGSGAGWVTAIILLLAVLVLGWFALSRLGAAPTPAEVNETVNVNVPTPDVPNVDVVPDGQ